jgi:hypothetical protein
MARSRQDATRRVTFNLTPVLLEQLDSIGAGRSDPYLVLPGRRPRRSPRPRGRSSSPRFDVNHERMLNPFPRYRDLFERKETSR